MKTTKVFSRLVTPVQTARLIFFCLENAFIEGQESEGQESVIRHEAARFMQERDFRKLLDALHAQVAALTTAARSEA